MQQPASIVNISSMGGFQGSSKYAGLSTYSSMKGALSILTECLAIELSASSIHVNALCLGAVQTEMLTQAFPGYMAPTDASTMASFIAHFALVDSTLFNGKIIPVAISNPS
jgi:NAD(P)-dependent dehydrogenase (short-subunit alcohol dehydrogenase family)